MGTGVVLVPRKQTCIEGGAMAGASNDGLHSARTSRVERGARWTGYGRRRACLLVVLGGVERLYCSAVLVGIFGLVAQSVLV